MSKQENETIIELKSVSKSFGLGDAESKALHKFDLTVKRGEFIMIMGPSGCGKTTLLNILGLLDKPTDGEYYLHGKPVSRISARKKARFRAEEIGFIFQNFNLIPTIPVIENVSLPLIYNGVSKTRRLKMADSILERFHLRQREYYMPYQLSGGQQQRVAIARSLISKPSIILADEPTGNLDSRSSHIIMEELRQIHSQGNTIIMVTHNPGLTAYATRVINMLDGEIDTDIKTVADSNLPQGHEASTEKIAVRVLSRRQPPEIEIESKTEVIVTGKHVQVADSENTEKKPAPNSEKEIKNSPYVAKPATAKTAPKPNKEKVETKNEQKSRKRRGVAKLSSLTEKIKTSASKLKKPKDTKSKKNSSEKSEKSTKKADSKTTNSKQKKES